MGDSLEVVHSKTGCDLSCDRDATSKQEIIMMTA